jgi:Kef-type K+ transport system membrane component KefB
MPKPLSDSEILLMFAALAAFVGLARLLGDAATRLRQPQVLGELAAGIIVGPSLLGLIAPAAAREAARGAHILEPVSWIGITFLLALTGMETDFASLRREGRPATFATLGGVIVPLAAGFAYALILPASFAGPHGSRFVFAAFLSLSMSISAVTVIAKVLNDLGQTKRSASKIILAGGIFDETLGWILLAVISGLAAGGGGWGETITIVVKAGLFLAAAALVGRKAVNAILRIVRDRSVIDDAAFTATVVLALAFAAITQAIGLHEVLGAFVFGVIAGTVPRIDRDTIDRVRVMTRGFLVPVFFLFAGMKVDLTQLGHRQTLLIAAGFIAIAILGKIFGCVVGGKIAGMALREAALVGIGMSARGSMEIVLAVLGLSLGILSPTVFSVIVLLSVVTIVVVPAALRIAFKAIPPSDDERKKIERQEQDAAAYTPNVRRVLVPLLPGAQSEIAAEAARALARSKAQTEQQLELVMLRVDGAPAKKSEQLLVEEVAQTDAERPIEIEEQAQVGDSPQTKIGAAFERGYQLAILGVVRSKRSDDCFGRVVNDVIRNAQGDVFVVYADADFDIDRVKSIVVPITGHEHARSAGDLAVALASGLGASVRAVNVLRSAGGDERSGALSELRDRAKVLEVAFEAVTETDAVPGRGILRNLRTSHGDLCILGATDQSRQGSPFFGDTADILLRSAPMPIGLLIVAAANGNGSATGASPSARELRSGA